MTMTSSQPEWGLDTNILVHATFQGSPYYAKAKAIRDDAEAGVFPACVPVQVLREFFAVITDPRKVSSPLSYADAAQEVENYLDSTSIRKIYSSPTSLAILLELIRKHGLRCQEVHDGNIVATLLANGVSHLYTHNVGDFAKFPMLTVDDPLV